jgi:hypothetical protein
MWLVEDQYRHLSAGPRSEMRWRSPRKAQPAFADRGRTSTAGRKSRPQVPPPRQARSRGASDHRSDIFEIVSSNRITSCVTIAN